MPAKDARNPAALPARIRLWLLDNPGQHRAVTIAKGLNRETQPVANALGRLCREGAVTRDRVSVEGRKLPVTMFSLPPQ